VLTKLDNQNIGRHRYTFTAVPKIRAFSCSLMTLCKKVVGFFFWTLYFAPCGYWDL